MNRFVSLLPAALALAAVSLAQPAQAQWAIGKPYYDPSSTLSQDANTKFTSTPVGNITLTSTPTSTNNAAGSYNGAVEVDCTWTGTPNSPGAGFVYTDTYTISGSCTGAGSANSNVGSGFNGTTTDPLTPGKYGKSSSTGAQTFVNILNVSKVTRRYTIGAATADSRGGMATGSASVTFGAPS